MQEPMKSIVIRQKKKQKTKINQSKYSILNTKTELNANI